LNEKTLDLLVNEAIKFARGVMDPLNAVGEEQGVRLEKGQVRCPAAFKDAFRQYGEDGWTAAAGIHNTGGRGSLT
jgi:hypothetical protein